MQAASMRGHVRDRLFEVTPSEFEVLCKMVLVRHLDAESLRVTAFQQDDGIDVEGVIDEGIIRARLGVQVKRYAEGNTVGNRHVQRFSGALRQGDHQIGTYVTSSSFTGPARDAAADLQICLVDGADLASLMVSNEIGVGETTRGYEVDAEFWQAFDRPEREDVVPSTEVPLANSFETLRAVLQGIDATDGSKTAVAAWVREHTDGSFDDRHADLYGIAGWLLGFVHKDTPKTVNGREVRRWGLTRDGVAYLERIEAGKRDDARERLVAAIRDVEIVQRVYAALTEDERLHYDDVKTVLTRETDLSKSSVRRRASTVGTWLATLPEVTERSDGRSKEFVVQ
ncbi:restriction endonuclease [Haloarculaceae archaeon H-GB11]|nr:restriction endonuclease [Haloarculaceae archaeon H-GB11]